MCSILVVEDDAAIRSALVTALADEGYEASASSNGDRAIRQLNESNVDLMLVDVHMPPLDGPDMIRILRGQGNDTPAILMSAQPRPQRQLPSGVTFVRKPFDLDRLFTIIEDVLAS